MVQIDGEPWFVAQDVCRTLDLAIDRKSGNVCFTPKRFTTINEDEVRLHLVQVNLKDGRKQRRKMHLLSESGLYKLITRSDKAVAKSYAQTTGLLALFRVDRQGCSGTPSGC